MSTHTLGPRPWRDYKTSAEARAAFLRGDDMTSYDMGSYGLAANLQDMRDAGVTTVKLRFRKLTEVVMIDVPKAEA